VLSRLLHDVRRTRDDKQSMSRLRIDQGATTRSARWRAFGVLLLVLRTLRRAYRTDLSGVQNAYLGSAKLRA
jgi:hypothetical protein